MRELRYTLVGDGSSDRALIPIVNWILRAQGTTFALLPYWAEFGYLREPPCGLVNRLRAAAELYPCDLLLVHRDCEAAAVVARQKEIIEAATNAFNNNGAHPPVVCIVPKRMTEAWLLISETVIRRASGNPSGTSALAIPRIRDLESLPDPKETLFSLLRTASNLQGRRLNALNVHTLVHRVAELIDDYSPLRQLSAFIDFERQLASALQQIP